jgi:hypothetical protein
MDQPENNVSKGNALEDQFYEYLCNQKELGKLGSRLIDIQSQKRTVAASAMAERNTFGHLS